MWFGGGILMLSGKQTLLVGSRLRIILAVLACWCCGPQTDTEGMPPSDDVIEDVARE